MGLLSGLKKGVKSIFNGIKKVFHKVGKFVGRAVRSKWGKLLLLAAAVYTGGLALGAWGGAAGAAGATSGGATFLTKFVSGAKNIVGAMTGQAGGAAGIAAGGPAGSGAGSGLFSQLGSFLKSPGGGTIASNLIGGFAQGKQQEALLKEEERIRRYYDEAWRDKDQLDTLGGVGLPAPSTPNLLARSREAAEGVPRSPMFTAREAAPATGVTY